MPRYYRRRSRNSDGFSVLIALAILTVLLGCAKLSSQTFQLLIAGTFLVATIGILFVTYIHYRRDIQEQRKLQALSMTDINAMDGLKFEKYVVQLLKGQGYMNVIYPQPSLNVA